MSEGEPRVTHVSDLSRSGLPSHSGLPMLRPFVSGRLLCGLTLVLSGGVVPNSWAQGFPAEVAVQKMTVAEGLAVDLVASEPLVRQPVAIDFDDRGRLWVLQYLQYPNPEGLQRVTVDRYSRTTYDRIPDPPPRGPRGADRLTILLDRNADGQSDDSRDFVSGLNLASGFAFGHGGVFVLNVPYLLFYPDRNRDDIPDGDPEVLITGFGMEDAHSVANSLTWGPDGWLYGCQGSTVTARIQGHEFQQGVWRYHPVTRRFELYCEGGGNSWGLDFDDHGQLLYCTNHGGYILLHGRRGASLWKLFSKHGGLHHRYAFGYFDHVPHQNFTGGHVTVGGFFYQGSNWPKQYHGAFIGGDTLGHAVHVHRVIPDRSTYRSEHLATVLQGNDTWFAPTDLALGPDGAVYVSDWYDARTAHPDPDAEWDRSNGRIYRLRGADRPASAPEIDTRSRSNAELLADLRHPDRWWESRARQELAARNDPAVMNELRQQLTAALTVPVPNRKGKSEHSRVAESGSDSESIAPADVAAASPSEWLRQVQSWSAVLRTAGQLDEETCIAAIGHTEPSARVLGLQWSAEVSDLSSEAAAAIDAVALHETDPRVLAELLTLARFQKPERGLSWLTAALPRAATIDDRSLMLLSWWAIEAHAATNPDTAWQLVNQPELVASPWGLELTSRLLWRLAAEGSPQTAMVCRKAIEQADSLDARCRLWKELEHGVSLATQPPTSDLVRAWIDPWWAQEHHRHELVRLALSIPYPAAPEAVWSGIASGVDRTAWLELLPRLPLTATEDVQRLLTLFDQHRDDATRTAVLVALQASTADDTAVTLLRRYADCSAEVQPRLRQLLWSRRPWARELLMSVERGELPAKSIPLIELTAISRFQDPELDRLVRQHWGAVTAGTPEERLAEVRRLNNDLRAGSGDVHRGSGLYKRLCAVCHPRAGEGPPLGPDLVHANRQDRQFLLISLVDPSAQVRGEYLQHVLQTVDGRVVSGLIAGRTDAAVTLRTAQQQVVTVPTSDIEQLEVSAVSLMPENLLKELSPQQLRDLFAYLQAGPELPRLEAPPADTPPESP
jgi:putative membrane-bound dehydrogenase-like protein